MGPHPSWKDRSDDLSPCLTVFPAGWAAHVHLGFHQDPRPWFPEGRRYWVPSCLWGEQTLVIPGCALGAVRLASPWSDLALERTVPLWRAPQPPTHHRASPGLGGGGPASSEATPSLLTYASRLTADSSGAYLRRARKMRDFQGQLCFLTQS